MHLEALIGFGYSLLLLHFPLGDEGNKGIISNGLGITHRDFELGSLSGDGIHPYGKGIDRSCDRGFSYDKSSSVEEIVVLSTCIED